MLRRSLLTAVAFASALCLTMGAAQAFDDALYPDWTGGWGRLRGEKTGSWDQEKPRGLGQQAPLTPEYQAIYEASLSDQDDGGQGSNPGYQCQPHGMPRVMNGNHPLFFAVRPDTTYIMRDIPNQFRRVYTDGRDWPARFKATANGYSIGKWLDEDGDGRYDTLAIETRGTKNPHSYNSSGIPLHADDRAVIKERITLDKRNPERMLNEITVIDNALTRPWTVTRSYLRARSPKWVEYVCAEDNNHVVIGKEDYLLSSDGLLMPVRKDQSPPDLRHFTPSRP